MISLYKKYMHSNDKVESLEPMMEGSAWATVFAKGALWTSFFTGSASFGFFSAGLAGVLPGLLSAALSGTLYIGGMKIAKYLTASDAIKKLEGVFKKPQMKNYLLTKLKKAYDEKRKRIKNLNTKVTESEFKHLKHENIGTFKYLTEETKIYFMQVDQYTVIIHAGAKVEYDKQHVDLGLHAVFKDSDTIYTISIPSPSNEEMKKYGFDDPDYSSSYTETVNKIKKSKNIGNRQEIYDKAVKALQDAIKAYPVMILLGSEVQTKDLFDFSENQYTYSIEEFVNGKSDYVDFCNCESYIQNLDQEIDSWNELYEKAKKKDEAEGTDKYTDALFNRLQREWTKCLRKLSKIANKNLNEKGYRIYFEDIDNEVEAGDGDEGYVIIKAI